MPALANRFRRIKPAAVVVVRRMVREGRFYRRSGEKKMDMLATLIRDLADVYGVPAPHVHMVDAPLNWLGGGEYDQSTNSIRIGAPYSLMTTLHEFRHMLQFRMMPEPPSDVEDDAQAWSHSLFRLALPRLYRDSLRKGKFFHG